MLGGEKGFHDFKKISPPSISPKSLVKKILTPPLVAMADQPHQLPGSVQRKGPRPPRQLESRFFRRAVALTVIAAVAASDQILPGRTTAARPGQHVVESQFRTRKNPPAELARIAISEQDILSRKRTALLRNVAVSKQANHGRHFVSMRG
jgi:hypothetical protein